MNPTKLKGPALCHRYSLVPIGTTINSWKYWVPAARYALNYPISCRR